MIFFFLLLAIGIILPSDGAHGLFAPKSLAFLLAAGGTLAHLLLHPRLNASQQRLLAFLFASLLFLLTWALIGSPNGPLALDQFKVFFITLSFIGMALYYLQEGVLTFPRLLKFALMANFFYSSLKITLALLHALHIFNLLALMEKLGIRFMSMHILGDVGRLQTSVDILTPFLLYFLLTSDSWGLHLSRTFKRLYIPFAWLSVALSFSRFLLFCALMAHVAYWFTETKKGLALSLLKFSLILLCLIPIAGPERLYNVIEKRFLSDESSRSDAIRAEQIEALTDTFTTTPYLGQGLGGYAKTVVRDPTLKYSYEVQWVAFLMQFGLLGLPLLLFPPFLLTLNLFPLTRLKASLFALFALWLASGLMNPFLISLASGILYALFWGALKSRSD